MRERRERERETGKKDKEKEGGTEMNADTFLLSAELLFLSKTVLNKNVLQNVLQKNGEKARRGDANFVITNNLL